MIKEGEALKLSGTALTSEEYAALGDDKTGLSYGVVVKQYGPDWARTETSDNLLNLRALNLGNESIVRAHHIANVWHVEMRGEDDVEWTNLPFSVAPAVKNRCVTLAVDGTTVYFFYLAFASDVYWVKLMTCDTSAETPEFGSSSTVYQFEHPLFSAITTAEAFAAVSTTKVYLSIPSSNSNHILCWLEDAGGWSLHLENAVYWPFPFDSLDAVALPDRDVVAMSGDLPPMWGTRAIGSEVSGYFQRVQGIIHFTVRNGRWSDYRTFDVIDRDVYGYSRSKLRLSRVNDYAMMSYNRHMIFRKYNDDGSLMDSSSASRLCPVVSRSINGVDWEFPEMVMKPATPFIVLATTGKLLAVASDGLFESNPCAWAGHAAPRSQTLTSSTLDIRSQSGDIRNTGIELANPYTSSGGLPVQILSNTLVDLNLRLLLCIYLGYWSDVVDGETTVREGLPILVSSEDVVKRTRTQQGFRQIMGLQSTDVLGRLVRTRSDYSVEWNSQIVSRDAFVDSTGTGYGGMRYMAALEGSWKASDGVLNLVSSMHRSLAESTQITDTLNGQAQIGFMLNDPTKKEYGGISFHVLDKDHFFYVFYDIESDRVQLCRNVSGGVDQIYCQSTYRMGWDTGGVWHYLRVVLRYAYVHAYSSDDGITWTEVEWMAVPSWESSLFDGVVAPGINELPGMEAIGESINYTQWSGKLGVVGKGYSDVDAPPPTELILFPDPEPAPVPSSADANEVWFATIAGKAYWSGDYFGGGQPTWNRIDLPSSGIPKWFGITRYGIAYAQFTEADGDHLYTSINPKDDDPLWRDILHPGSLIYAGYRATRYFNYTFGPCAISKNCLYTFVHCDPTSGKWMYAVHNGSGWSYSCNVVVQTFNIFGAALVGKKVFGINNIGDMPRIYSDTFGLTESLPQNTLIGYEAYVSPGGNGYYAYVAGDPSHLYIRQIAEGVVADLGIGQGANDLAPTKISGAEEGPQVYVVSGNDHNDMRDGHLWLSEDGSSFADVATWDRGWVRDATVAGGGSLVWILGDIVSNNTPTRLYNRDGSVLRDMTGNFWDLASGDQEVVGMGLVY
jgi:hypothetical protein